MSILSWLSSKFGAKAQVVNIEDILKTPEAQSMLSELFVREVAFWACVNKIASVLSKCEFRVYIGGKETKGSEYYLWNIEPNPNQNAADFLRKLISILYRNNEALVIEHDQKLYVADSFSKEEYALRGYRFSSVSVDNMTFNRGFNQADVLYWKLNNRDMRALLNTMTDTYGKLIQYAAKSYLKSRGNRGILRISATAAADQNFKKNFSDLMNQYFKDLFSSENAVLPLFEGYDYTDISSQSKTYSTESTRDIKSLYDDIFDFTARAFSFPPSLAKGDVQDTEKATDELLTFCIDPLARMLEKEINRKRNGFEGFVRGNRIHIDTTAVKHIDVMDIATAIDKLISSGAFTINDVRRTIGENAIDENWADKHFITKNYSFIEEVLKQMDLNTS